MTEKNLINDFKVKLKSFRIEDLKENTILIHTPFVFSSGDMLAISCLEKEGDLFLSVDGQLLFRQNTIEKIISSLDKNILEIENICKYYNVNFVDLMFIKVIESEINYEMSQFLSCLININYLLETN